MRRKLPRCHARRGSARIRESSRRQRADRTPSRLPGMRSGRKPSDVPHSPRSLGSCNRVLRARTPCTLAGSRSASSVPFPSDVVVSRERCEERATDAPRGGASNRLASAWIAPRRSAVRSRLAPSLESPANERFSGSRRRCQRGRNSRVATLCGHYSLFKPGAEQRPRSCRVRNAPRCRSQAFVRVAVGLERHSGESTVAQPGLVACESLAVVTFSERSWV